jgi:hypothetical protein
MKSLTVTALSLIVAALLSIGGLVFALFDFFPLFLLGLPASSPDSRTARNR